MPANLPESVDVVIIGSGAAGLVAAVTASNAGLSTVVLEKTSQIGGTTALSEGMVWVPGSEHAVAAGVADNLDDAVAYVAACSGNRADLPRIRAYVENAAPMLSFLVRETEVGFRLSRGSIDYYPELPGASRGARALNPEVFDARKLSRADLAMIRPPLPTMMLLGGMSVASFDVSDYYNASKSPAAAMRVMGYILRYASDRLKGYPRGARLGNGNGLVAALLLALRGRRVPVAVDTAVTGLVSEGGRVAGIHVSFGGVRKTIRAKLGVVIASGSFSASNAWTEALFDHRKQGGPHLPLPPRGSDGDGMVLAQSVGGDVVEDLSQPALWAPSSRVPMPDGSVSFWPHFSDRAKPGVMAVDLAGQRFVNEACTYRDFVETLIAVPRGNSADIGAYAIFDHRALRTYGFGPIGPKPVPIGRFLRSGYLVRGDTIAGLASRIELDPAVLMNTVERYNRNAASGRDPDFHKGESAYDRGNGDAAAAYPNLRPLTDGPFYAVRLYPGDLGTFVGVRTDAGARVLTERGEAVPGLFAAGNAAATIAGGSYPAAGITIGSAMVFGYIAARTLMKDAAQ